MTLATEDRGKTKNKDKDRGTDRDRGGDPDSDRAGPVCTPDSAKWAVQASHLSKSYHIPVRQGGFLGGLRTLISQQTREVQAIRDLSFGMQPGEFVGYIGPNGAGKSTTVKILTGILHPTSGRVQVNGLSPQSDRARLARSIGVVFGQRSQLWWDLPTIDSFDILAAMYEVDRGDYRRFLDHFDELLGLGELLDTPVRRLSLGQRMRAELAAALLHRPRLLFLDEPTIGLDVIAKGRIRQFLAQLNRTHGVTILLTTHDLRDIEELCQRVLVISRGSLIYDGPLESLREQAGLPTILSVKYVRLPAALQAGVNDGSPATPRPDDPAHDRGSGWTSVEESARQWLRPPQYIGPGGEILDKPANGVWRIASVDTASATVEVLFDRGRSAAPAVVWAMQTLGDIQDLSMAEPPIDRIIERLLERPER